MACGKPLPLVPKNSKRRHCDVGCRVRAHYIRHDGRPKAKARRQDNRGDAAVLLGGEALAAAAAKRLSDARERSAKPLAPDFAQPNAEPLILGTPATATEDATPPQSIEAHSADRLAHSESALQSQTLENADLRRQLAQAKLHCELLANRDTENQAIIAQLFAQLANADAARARLQTELAEKAARLATSEAERSKLAAALDVEITRGNALQLCAAQAESECARLGTECDEMRRQRDGVTAQLTASNGEKSLADGVCVKLRAKREELRGLLQQARQRCGLLAEKEADTRSRLAASEELSARRKQKLLMAREKIGILQDRYEDLEIEHNALADRLITEYRGLLASIQDRLIAEYRGLLAAKEQHYLQLAQTQQRAMAAASEHQHPDYYEVRGENSRLNIECSRLQGQVDTLQETVAHLKAKVKVDQQQLRQQRRPAALEQKYPPPELESGKTNRPSLGSGLRTAGKVLLAGAGAVLAVEGAKRCIDNSHALAAAAAESAPRMEGGRGASGARSLPPAR